MARNLLQAGTPLTVWNRTPAHTEALARSGATAAKSIEELFESTETVILMLSDDLAVDAVLRRGTDAFAPLCQGRTLVPMGTTSAAHSKRLSQDVQNAGGHYVEAPVSGSRIPAELGELLILLAGVTEATAHVPEILQPLGKTIDCGAVPDALLMKHATNLALSPTLLGLAEGVAFARRAGIDLELYQEVLLGGQIASGILRAKLPRMLASDYTPQGAIRNAVDSLTQTLRTAEEIDFEPRVLRLCRDLLVRAAEAGLEEEDIVAVEKVLGADDKKA